MEIYIHVGAAHRLQNWFQTINLNFLLSPSKGKKENAQVKFQVRDFPLLTLQISKLFRKVNSNSFKTFRPSVIWDVAQKELKK